MRHDWTSEERAYIDNLLGVYSLATRAEITSGKLWYPRAQLFAAHLAEIHHVSLSVSAGVISALSPGTEWSRNKRNADEFLSTYRKCGPCALDRLDLTTYGKLPISKAHSIARGKDVVATLHGPKTTAFYHAILDPLGRSHVVIDSHAKAAALGVRSYPPVRAFEYPHLERAFLTAADHVKLYPNEFQATVWLVWKQQPTGFTLPTTKALGVAA
jgi:hypothetical protein